METPDEHLVFYVFVTYLPYFDEQFFRMQVSTQIFLESLKKAPLYWLRFIRQHYIVLSIIYSSLVVVSLVTHYLSNHPEYKSALTLVLSLWVYLCSLVLVGVSALFIVPYFFQKLLNKESESYIYVPKTFGQFFKTHFRPWVKEMSKVMGLSYLWGLLFIIPGIFKFVRCSFVSYIALFNRPFQRREISALKHSQKLTEGFMLCFLTMIAIYVVSTYPLTSLLQSLKVEGMNAGAVVAIFADYFVSLSSCVFFSIVYHLVYLKLDYGNTVDTESYEDVNPPVSLSL